MTLKEDFSEEEIIRFISSGPAEILGFNLNINKGEKANITLFTPEGSTNFGKSDIECLSKNSPFIGAKLRGKVIGVINNNKINLI